MTDGIIQKVFRKYNHAFYGYDSLTFAFNKLEQELIEEIKEKSGYEEVWGIRMKILGLDELIGDNE